MSEGQKYHCGPRSWPKFIRKRLSRYHNDACLIHDKAYEVRLTSRKEIDKTWLDMMLINASNQATPNRRKKAKRHAYWLYFWVRKFAWVLWLKKKGGQK